MLNRDLHPSSKPAKTGHLAANFSYAGFWSADLDGMVGVERKLANTYLGGRYGPLLEQVRHAGLTNRLIILDDGEPKEIVGDKPEFAHYSPEAYFYAGVETSRGLTAQVLVPGTDLAAGTWVATCDPRSDEWLTQHYRVSVILEPNQWCKLVRTLP